MKNDAQIKQFKKRNKIAFIVTVLVGAIVGIGFQFFMNNVGAVFQGRYIIGIWAALGIVQAVLWAGILTASLLIWLIVRCPACKKYAGFNRPKFCSKCGTALQ